jgi:uncharacterized C2H2 Zn-finger protein
VPTNHAVQHYAAVHQRRGIKCLACPKEFKAPSAIAHHLESGRHGVNRHQITAAVQALDIIPTISLKRRINAPGTIVGVPTLIRYLATPLAFNGFAYECHICHSMFRSLSSLTSHLNSPAHDVDQFKCPRCAKHFKLISALVQHIESGCCGLAPFQRVMHHFQNMTALFSRALTFR